MTKRLISLVLALVMVMAMIVVPTQATETEQETTHEVGYCQHCKTEIPAEQWVPWDASNLGPKSGHYYLAEDVNDQAKQITINLDDDNLRNTVCLDLRGRTYTVEKFRPFLIYGIFSIMDSVGGGEISTTGQTSNANGGFCQLGKNANCKDAGVLNLYSGTIRKVNTDTEIVAYGGLVYAAGGATFNMYGGKLIGGDVHGRLNSKGSPVAALGGTIHASGAYVNLYGGTVTGGVANDTTVTLEDKTTKSTEACGGNIYAEKSSKVLIDGGTVENGYSDTYSGNIYLKDATLEIKSGSVIGGYSEGAAGNINIGGASTFIMSGGVIKNGVCTTTGGNLRVNNTGAVLEISGGEIYGDIYAGLYKSFTLSGSPKIYMGLGNGLRLASAGNATKMDISGLTEGAEIYLDGVDQTFTDVLENPETYHAYFKDAIRADITVTENGELAVAQGITGFCPHCWESGVQATWTAWLNSGSTSTDLISEKVNAHYYLTATTSRKGVVSIGTSTEKTNDIVFDMAGKTWTTTNKKLFNLYAQLSLLDSVGGGKMTSTGHAEANGGLIMGTGSGVFNMYSGTLSRTVKTGEELKNVLVGGILYAPAGSATNVYGGTIRDGISASVSAKKNTCRGGNIYAAGSFTMTAGALIGGKAYNNSYILQDTANPILNSSDKETTYIGTGGNLYVSDVATITGGHLVDGNASYGGNLYVASSAKLSISGAVIRDGLANETAGTVNPEHNLYMYGGNLYIAGSSSKRVALTIENTIFRGGNAREFGGNMYATVTDLTLRNCTITGGVAGLETDDGGRGGNLYLTGTVVCDMYDTVVGEGYALDHGGNLYAPGGIDFRMHSGLFVGGETNGYGGNMYCNGLTMESGVVTGGTSGSNGGNIFVYESDADTETPNYLNIAAVEGKPAPIISNGTGGAFGGNITVSKYSVGTITGAIIENGSGDTKGGTASYNADNLYGNTGSSLTLTDTVIRGISDNNYSGNGIYAMGSLTLKGNTRVINEAKNSCIFLTNEAALTVDASFTGEAAVGCGSAHFATPEEPQGGTLAEQNTATGVFTGKLYLDGHGDYDYGLPAIFAEEGDSKLYVASTAVITLATEDKEESFAWFREAQAAMDAATSGSYIRLFASNNQATVSGSHIIDLNGNNLALSGSGSLACFDSANDTYETFGYLTLNGDISVAKESMAPNGRRYIALEDENGTSFHRLGIATTEVSLRPSVSGIYYKAAWACDAMLQEKIESFGVAVSTENMPGKDFATDEDTLYTVLGADSFISGQSVPGALISNITKEGQDNQTRGTMPIYAVPYAVVDGVTVVADENAPAKGGVAYSLQSVLQRVDKVWPKVTDNRKQGIRELYKTDDAFKSWNLYNITADITGTPSVRPLKILTLGHSLMVDSGHMINLVAAAEGYDQPLTIATLYESGCKLSEHVQYSSTDSPKYSLYLSSTLTPDKPPVILPNYTMKKALEYDDWDIVIMQGGVFEVAHESSFTNGNIEFIKDYVRKHVKNPDFIFAWHAPWVTPLDNDLRDMYPYSPNSYYVNYEKYFDNDRSKFYTATFNCVEKYIITDPDYIYLVPSGTALENALSSYLEETDLHRDYAHATDFGRVIASYTWYCTLTGVDHLDEIKLDAIPAAFFKSTKGTEDKVLTDMEKAIILESVNNAIADPTHVTQSQYTAAPTE